MKADLKAELTVASSVERLVDKMAALMVAWRAASMVYRMVDLSVETLDLLAAH